MRRIGACVVVLVYLLAAPPVVASEDAAKGGSWWSAVLSWVKSGLDWPRWVQGDQTISTDSRTLERAETTGDVGPGIEPDGLWGHSSAPTS